MKAIEMYTVGQAAERLGVSRARVGQFIRAGRLVALRMSPRLLLIPPGELTRFSRISRKPGRKFRDRKKQKSH